MTTSDYTTRILKLAKKALAKKEVPIGAIVVDASGQVVGQGYNLTHTKKDGLQHAELVAIRQAQKKLGDWRLESTALYVTVEPCLMCLGAAINARIAKVGYILADPLFGSAQSKFTKAQLAKIAPKLKIEKLADDGQTAKLMAGFFTELRAKGKVAKGGPKEE